MGSRGRTVFGVLAVAAFLWMLFLFSVSPGDRELVRAGEDGGEFRVTCGSISAAGWPTDPLRLDAANLDETEPVEEFSSALPDAATLEAVAAQCQDVRTTRVALIALLAAPTALAGAVALFARQPSVPTRRS